MKRAPGQFSCMRSKECTNIKVIAFGNVVVSYNANLEDTKLLDRYKLSTNTKCVVDAETLAEITTQFIANKEQHKPRLGGSAMMTVCALKYMGTEPLFFGACGTDKESEIIYELLENANMEKRLQSIPHAATDRSISLVHNDSMCLYTTNGASLGFTCDYLQNIEKEENSSFLRPLNRKQLFYIEGWFVPHRESVTSFIVNQYIKGRRYLALNLSSVNLVRANFSHMQFLANNALFIFGNKDEFETFRECWGAKCIMDLAKCLVGDSKQPKILVITKGAEGVEMITNYVREKSSRDPITVQTFKVTPIENKIVITGCGDVFVAAFLHTWLKKRSLSQCVHVAIFHATRYIENSCQLPDIKKSTNV